MKITTIDGIQYVKLCDLERLSKKLRKEVYNKYEKDEKGCRHLSEQDVALVGGYSHFMTEVLIDEIHACDTPDEIRKLHADLEHDFYKDKWVIKCKDGDQTLYYEKYCVGALRAKMEGEGASRKEIESALTESPEGVPVFTSDALYANYFDYHDIACLICDRINREYPDIGCEVIFAAYTSGKECKRLLNAIFNEGTEKQEEDNKDLV